jgi:hypothetical protein
LTRMLYCNQDVPTKGSGRLVFASKMFFGAFAIVRG